MIYTTEQTPHSLFYENFVWYLHNEDRLALQERDDRLARAVRDTYADLLPVSKTTEGQVAAFNAACAAYPKFS